MAAYAGTVSEVWVEMVKISVTEINPLLNLQLTLKEKLWCFLNQRKYLRIHINFMEHFNFLHMI